MNFKVLSIVLVAAVLGAFGAFQLSKSKSSSNSPFSLESLGGYKNLSRDELYFRLALFRDWMVEFDRSYSLSESPYKFKVWNENYDIIQEHNAKNLSWTYGLNQFSDLTPEEFAALHLGFNAAEEVDRESNIEYLDENNLEAKVDWIAKGAVGSVKDQGSCGACYAFASVSGLEGLHFIKKGNLVNLSNQQIAACSSSYGNQGCNGGLMTYSYEYTKAKGIQNTSTYGWTGDMSSCKYNSAKTVFQNTGYTNVPKSYTQLKAAVNKQPVPVGVQASGTLQNYKSGIIKSNCGTAYDHAVTVVGYDDSTNAWTVRNQWNAKWGEQGYFRVAIGAENNGAGLCGINGMATYPTI